MVAGGQARVVAKKFGVSTMSIWLWCKLAGVQGRGTNNPPTCHPDRPHYGRGRCRKCYRAEWEANGHVVGPRRRAVTRRPILNPEVRR